MEVDRAPWQVFPVLFLRRQSRTNLLRERVRRASKSGAAIIPVWKIGPGTTKLAACPNARSLAERMIALPIYSDITEDEVSHIVEIVRRCLQKVLSA